MPKEIDVVEILKRAFTLLTKDPEIILLYAIPAIVSTIFVFSFFGRAMGTLSGMLAAGQGIAALGTVFGSVAGFVVVMVILNLWVTAATILKTDAAHSGRRLGIGGAAALAVGKIPRLFVATVAAGLAVLLGLVALIIPGIYLYVRLALVDPAVVLEKKGLGLGKSWTLTKGRGWEIFVLALLLMIISIAVNFVPVIGAYINQMVVAPLAVISFTLVYLRLKG